MARCQTLVKCRTPKSIWLGGVALSALASLFRPASRSAAKAGLKQMPPSLTSYSSRCQLTSGVSDDGMLIIFMNSLVRDLFMNRLTS